MVIRVHNRTTYSRPDAHMTFTSCLTNIYKCGPEAEIETGNCLPLENIPVGTQIHNIELQPGKGGQLVQTFKNFNFFAVLCKLDNSLLSLRSLA